MTTEPGGGLPDCPTELSFRSDLNRRNAWELPKHSEMQRGATPLQLLGSAIGVPLSRRSYLPLFR